jgi:hypothetical protein
MNLLVPISPLFKASWGATQRRPISLMHTLSQGCGGERGHEEARLHYRRGDLPRLRGGNRHRHDECGR